MEESRGGLTLVFTDIEGSTGLLRELQGSYGLALRVHHSMLERCFENEGGIEINSEGDGLFVVFPSARQAVAAAIAAQQKCEHYAWPDGVRLRVRIGIHTGQVRVSGGVYVGLTVHEASRICNAAHGGQILCSASVASALEDVGPGVGLRDLGVYVLRGFPEGRHLYQLCADGLEAEFPLPRDSIRYGGVRVSMWFRGEPKPDRQSDAAADGLTFRSPAGHPLGDDVEVEILPAAGGVPDAFRLTVRHNETVEEEYDGLTVGGATDAAAIVNAHSRLIRIQT